LIAEEAPRVARLELRVEGVLQDGLEVSTLRVRRTCVRPWKFRSAMSCPARMMPDGAGACNRAEKDVAVVARSLYCSQNDRKELASMLF